MKYKVGDRVKIKSLGWYNENNVNGDDILENIGIFPFFPYMARFCGQVLTIKDVHITYYTMEETDYYTCWTDEMIEGLVEKETKVGTALNPIEPKSNANCLTQERVDEMSLDKAGQITNSEYEGLICTLPDGYQFVDEKGNVINARKIVLEKKKKEYPKTYEECSLINGAKGRISLSIIGKFTKLINARNAYWKIAGEEMGLGTPWEPDWRDDTTKYTLVCINNGIEKDWELHVNHILAFPTKEMRDAFYENFKELIESCKELL